jgi:hypothetical protein
VSLARIVRGQTVEFYCVTFAKLVSVEFRSDARHDRSMLELLIVIGRALALASRGHTELVLENLALR